MRGKNRRKRNEAFDLSPPSCLQDPRSRDNRYRQHVKYLSNVIGRTTNKEREIGEEIDGVGARLRGEVDQKTRSANSFLWMPYRRSRKLETVPNDSSSPVEFSIIFTAL